jgi:proteasome accessory factor A
MTDMTRNDTNDNDREFTGDRLPKLCGGDIELGNFVLGLSRKDGTGQVASRALLREINGLPQGGRYESSCNCSTCRARREEESGRGWKSGGFSSGSTWASSWGGGGFGYNPQDWGRKFLPDNGGCVYIDLDHLEVCLPEVISAYDHVASWHAMLQIARGALHAANDRLPDGQKIQVLVNNSDGLGNSYGSHLDFLVTRRAWENLFHRKIHHMLYLAAFQASSIVLTGQGKVGAENNTPEVAYQIGQRPDFLETLVGEQTTYRRPLVNSRDEALCGRSRYGFGEKTDNGLARLHVIFFDSTLCHAANLLKVGLMQVMLAMLEVERINPNLILDDPVDAVIRWSHDPTLQARARLANGKKLTAVELQSFFLDEARRFVEQGGCEGLVPRAGEIVALWDDTLAKLRAGDLDALAGRLDWVLKLCILRRAMQQVPGLTWESPQLKHLDHLYSSLDRAEGLYWAYERGGLVERLVTANQVERFVHQPPEDTRAWARAMLLRQAGPDGVDDVDWDLMRFKLQGQGYWSNTRRLEMADPLAFTRAEAEPVLRKARTLEEALDALDALRPDADDSGSKGKANKPASTRPRTWLPAYPVAPARTETDGTSDTNTGRDDAPTSEGGGSYEPA